MRVELTDDPAVFMRRDWTHVVEGDRHATFFHTPAYLKLWWEEFGSGPPIVAVALEGREVVGACAFERSEGTLTFMGGFDVTDYMGPVAAAGKEEVFATHLMEAIACDLDWHTADLRGLPDGSPWAGLLAREAGSRGLAVGPGRDDVAPFVSLPGTFEEYLAGLPAKLRHEIRRKGRRLREDAGEYRVGHATALTLGDDMTRFLELHRRSPGPKGRFMRPGMEIFFRRLGEEFLPRSVLQLSFLEIEGEQVAATLGFAYGRTFSLYNSAFDRRFESLAPGMVLVAELIRGAVREGRTGFDLLKGDLAYKYRFGAGPRRIGALRIGRKTRALG